MTQGGTGTGVGKTGRRVALITSVAAALVAAACADVSAGPETPASIELSDLPYPSVVVGDTLRDANGVVARVRAIVRNNRGDSIGSTGTRYLYADYNRDSALFVDSTSGLVVARKAATATARIAARVSTSLQVLHDLFVTVRPDSMQVVRNTAVLTTVFPDTGRARATSNTTENLSVKVLNYQATTVAGVNGWLVRFQLIRPANPTNDTTLSAWLVNDNGSASVIDTTDAAGLAGRKVRIRANLFPAAGQDSVVVRAFVTYKGQPIALSGGDIVSTVKRGTP